MKGVNINGQHNIKLRVLAVEFLNCVLSEYSDLADKAQCKKQQQNEKKHFMVYNLGDSFYLLNILH